MESYFRKLTTDSSFVMDSLDFSKTLFVQEAGGAMVQWNISSNSISRTKRTS